MKQEIILPTQTVVNTGTYTFPPRNKISAHIFSLYKTYSDAQMT